MRWFLILLLSLASWADSLVPLPGRGATPALTEIKRVRVVTTVGDMLIEVYPQAAPNASKRFLELVGNGFYDFSPVFRVVPQFVAQFGINWRDKYPEYQKNNFKDDPSLFRLDPGTLAFAKAGPDTNSTQVFINFRNNDRLVAQNFTAFAKVVEGLDVAMSFAQVGDPSMGLEQDQLWGEGDKYLRKLKAQPSYILYAYVLEP